MAPADARRVLVISHEIVGSHMAGPGIRYYHLARVLSREFPVTLAVPAGSTPEPWDGCSILAYQTGEDAALEREVLRARVIMVPAVWFSRIPSLLHTPAPLVVDGYDPCLVEMFFLRGNASAQQADLTQAYLAGDFFVCASERQRDWWLGLLEASGRLNVHTFGADPSLRNLVDLVPFGLPETAPRHTRPTIKGIWDGIAEHDRVILWGGGLWPWLDPLTAIRAMAKVRQHRQDVQLIFPGTRHPNPAMAGMPAHTESAFTLASELGLLKRGVFFGDWVAYDDWQNVVLESDLALTLHYEDTLETRLAFRSRVLDYLWAALPIVATRGDAASELIAQYDMGILVGDQDAGAVAEAILCLLDRPRELFQSRLEQFRASLTWENAAKPLIEFCRHPQRAADRLEPSAKTGNSTYANEISNLRAESQRLRALVSAFEQRRAVRWANQAHAIAKHLLRK